MACAGWTISTSVCCVIGFLPCHFADPWVAAGDMRAIRPRAYAFSSIHRVAYRKTDAQRSLVQAFLAALFDATPAARSI
ncbi:hypothetical protein ACVDG5_007030 [Mesorhizobium sp. ORM6]